MNSWYIDRSKNFINDTLDMALQCIDSCEIKDAPFVEKNLSESGALGEAGSNPKAALTRLRDHGLLRMDNTIGDSTRDYLNKTLTSEELVIDLLLKRSASKSKMTFVKPLVLLCRYFSVLMNQAVAEKEIFITFQECHEYLFPCNEYETCGREWALRIVKERVYPESDETLPIPRIQLTSNEKTSMSIWFNALKSTPIFEGESRDVLRPALKQKAFIDFISENADEFEYIQIENDNDLLYKYYCDRSTGINEILENPVKRYAELKEENVNSVVEYIFGISDNLGTEYSEYFRYECFGLFRPFILLPGLVARKISERNDSIGSKILECCRKTDIAIIIPDSKPSIKFKTEYKSTYERNLIVFGAPGTGKSFSLNSKKDGLLEKGGSFERVTFHPDYSYANFVGTYKPVPIRDQKGNDSITYEYVPGPFMRTLAEALKYGKKKEVKPVLLIIEEINRANVAAVFGDVFQLLDRDENHVSEYSINATEDMKRYLRKEVGGLETEFDEIRIPDNMFIWASMNSADQGVFPMDTAFKRRWDFEYIGINDNDMDLIGKTVVLGSKTRQKIEWNKLRKAINDYLAKIKINEDKQLGPYFISRKIVVPETGVEIDSDQFINRFKSKVIMYLFEDAGKQRRSSIFEGCFEKSSRYSDICKEFDEKGIGIFNHDIQIATEPEDLS